MNPLNVIRDALYFSRRNLASIVMLCLPLVVLEALTKEILDGALSSNAASVSELLIGLLFYPLYTAALILFLDARSQGEHPRKRDLLAMALRLWPTFALLSALSTLLIMAGLSLFILPGVWVMIKLAFAEYLLVLRGLAPMAAMRQSMAMTKGHFVQILICLLCVYLPLVLLGRFSLMILPDPQNPLIDLAIDSASSFLQLFTSVVMFRLFMLVSEPTTDV